MAHGDVLGVNPVGQNPGPAVGRALMEKQFLLTDPGKGVVGIKRPVGDSSKDP
jgi:hypothetical protein